jgi:hypothetical protein
LVLEASVANRLPGCAPCSWKVEGIKGENRGGPFRRERGDPEAWRLLGEELRRADWVEADLSRRPKNNPAEQAFAARRRRETTLTFKQIAHVKLGTSKSANARLLTWTRNPALGNKAA